MIHRSIPTGIVLALAVSACEMTDTTATGPDVDPDFGKAVSSENFLDAANVALAGDGSEYRISHVEYYTDPSSGEMGNVIFANDRGNKQLGLDFIPNDPRRVGVDGDPNTIDVLVDLTEATTASGLSASETTAAISRSAGTWDAASCSEMNPSFTPVPFDLGLVQLILGFGGGFVVPDVMHAGWLPGAFFDLLAPGGSGFILGATFTLTFTSGDLDGNGLADLAAREIYYNDAFSWADDGTSNFDVETVALHEGGHGLSQGHFGKIFGTVKNQKIHFAPRAVMNASYSGVQRSLGGTDNGGHCSLWAAWPNN